jgi:hypothetical protein
VGKTLTFVDRTAIYCGQNANYFYTSQQPLPATTLHKKTASYKAASKKQNLSYTYLPEAWRDAPKFEQ